MLKAASVHRLQIINRKLFFCELAWCVLRLWERLNANVCVRECVCLCLSVCLCLCVFVCVCLLGVCSASGSEREQVQMTIAEFGAWNIQLFIVGAERPQDFLYMSACAGVRKGVTSPARLARSSWHCLSAAALEQVRVNACTLPVLQR